jgi:septum site-determining protein MinC
MIFLYRNVIIQIITPNTLIKMSTDAEASIHKKTALEFKSTSFTAPVLVLFTNDSKQIELQLAQKIAQAPEFFKHSALLIDLQEINKQKKTLDLTLLTNSLLEKNLIPIGISGGTDEQNELAIKLKIPIHTIRKTVANKATLSQKITPDNETVESIDKALDKPEPTIVQNKFISQPIRSGQRIYAKGDLTILSHVSAGAEIMAEGNIHVYGALRGRALAGVQGDTESRIFCSDFQAELVSIAGHYKMSEELDKPEHHKPTQIFLQDQALIIKNI